MRESKSKREGKREGKREEERETGREIKGQNRNCKIAE